MKKKETVFRVDGNDYETRLSVDQSSNTKMTCTNYEIEM